MEMSGEQSVPLARDEVWKALNDAEVLKACIPGCEGVDKQSDTAFTATVNAKVGPVKSRFKGDVTLSDMDPPNSYRLNFQGQGVAGFTKGYADVKLVDEGEGTRIIYGANATVGGKLAQVGARLVDGAARKMANEFFSNLTEHLGGTTEKAAGQTPQGPESATKPQEQVSGEASQPSKSERTAPEAPPAPGSGTSASATTPSGAAAQPTGPAPSSDSSQPAGTNRTVLWVVIAVVVLVILWLILR